MSTFWDDKWATAKTHFEGMRTKQSDPAGVIAGLQPLKPRASIPGPTISKDMHQMLLSGNVGRSVDLPEVLNDRFGEIFSILDVTGPDAYSQLMTVAVAPRVRVNSSIKNPFTANAAEIRAEIQYGTGGYQHTLYMDVGRGISFSVVASNIRVNIVRTKRGIIPIGTVTVGATVGYGAIAERAAPPTISDKSEDALAVGAIATKSLPPYASRVSFLAMDAVGNPPTITGSIAVRFRTDGDFPSPYIYVPFDRLYISIPIPGDAFSMQVENTAAQAIAVSYIYYLSP